MLRRLINVFAVLIVLLFIKHQFTFKDNDIATSHDTKKVETTVSREKFTAPPKRKDNVEPTATPIEALSPQNKLIESNDARELYHLIYDEDRNGVNLSVLNIMNSQNNLRSLIQLIEYDSTQSIEFSTRVSQSLQKAMLDQSLGYVDNAGCYESLCIAELTTFNELSTEQLNQVLDGINMRNLVLSKSVKSGEYIYQVTFTSSNDISVLVGQTPDY